MKRSFLAGSAIVLVCLCHLGQPRVTHALTQEATGSETSVFEQRDQSEAEAISREVRIFSGVAISIRVAMATVEKQVGAKVVDASFDGRADRPIYRIKAVHDRKIWSGAIDTSTGAVVGTPLHTDVSDLDAKDKVDLAGLEAAGIALSDAAEIAETQTGGTALSAGLGDAAGKFTFKVVVVADGMLKEVSIDPALSKR